MSLLTRCPACTTLYKVVPDQLRISQGWVKCGQCGEIFDASQHLMEVSSDPENLIVDSSSESAPVPRAESNDIDQPALDGDLQTEQPAQAEQKEPQSGDLPAVAPEPDRESSSELTTESVPGPQAEPVLPSEPVTAVSLTTDLGSEIELVGGQSLEDAVSVPPEGEPSNFASIESDDLSPQTDVDAQPDLEPAQQQAAESGLTPGQDARATESLATSTPPSFMRDAEQISVRYHPLAQFALVSLAGLLTLALGAQWIYQDHDRLAAAQPQWKPALETICNPLRCSVKSWQQIESIAIDAVAFSKLGGDRYRLSFTLKNAASVMLAWPSVELTLTDMQDHVVVRRVLLPYEQVAAADHLAASSELPVVVNLRITPEASDAPFVGYRLLAFYP
ncbi:MAG TPA: zinc-ribbon and DUF3426 domain-containing protein [Rhodoferax sp.]